MFLDLAKAFEIVNNPILLDKLDCYGIRDKVHRLMFTYFTAMCKSE